MDSLMTTFAMNTDRFAMICIHTIHRFTFPYIMWHNVFHMNSKYFLLKKRQHKPTLPKWTIISSRPLSPEVVKVHAAKVGLRGSVVRAANIAPLITELNFTCSRCSSEVISTTVEGRFEYPSSCPKKCTLDKGACKRSVSFFWCE